MCPLQFEALYLIISWIIHAAASAGQWSSLVSAHGLEVKTYVSLTLQKELCISGIQSHQTLLCATESYHKKATRFAATPL